MGINGSFYLGEILVINKPNNIVLGPPFQKNVVFNIIPLLPPFWVSEISLKHIKPY